MEQNENEELKKTREAGMQSAILKGAGGSPSAWSC
jgi:hypothetical protein